MNAGAEPQWVFSGRIHPERANVSVHIPVLLGFGSSPDRLASAEVDIAASQVSVRVTGDPGVDLATLRNWVQVVVSSAVDVLGWSNGCGYTVEISSSRGPEGHQVFGVDVPVLVANPPGDTPSTEDVMLMMLNDPEGRRRSLRRSLADFRQAILFPDDTPFYCFRAVEALMYAVGRRDRKDRRELCRRLRIDEKWIIETLEKPAGAIRHGDLVWVTDADRASALAAAREVIDRFIVLEHSEADVVPEERFPQLSLDRLLA